MGERWKKRDGETGTVESGLWIKRDMGGGGGGGRSSRHYRPQWGNNDMKDLSRRSQTDMRSKEAENTLTPGRKEKTAHTHTSIM